MWDYSFVVPSAFVLTIFSIFYVLRPRLPVKAKRTFITLLIVEVMTMVSDVCATMLDEHHENFSILTLYILNTLYFILFVYRIYLFFIFEIHVMNLRMKDAPIIAALSIGVRMVSMLAILSSFITGYIFFIDGDGYHSGPYYDFLYVVAYFYIAIGFVVLFFYGRELRRLHKYSIFTYLGLLLVAFIIRKMAPGYLVMDMFSMLVIVLIYLAFENPDFYLDRNSGLFNRDGFGLVLDELNGKQKYKVAAFAIKEYQENRDMYGAVQMDRGIQLIAEYLQDNFPEVSAFYVRNGRFALISRNDDLNEVCGRIRERFEHPWFADGALLYLYIGFVFYESREVEATEDVISALRLALSGAARMQQTEDIHIESRAFETIEHQKSVRKALERAIDYNSVEVYLQPVVKAGEYKVVGAEALARIFDPDLGFVSPEDFIPVAEANGSIAALGHQVLEKTCEFIREHNRELGLEFINVNLSPIQCMNKNLPGEFNKVLEKYNIPSSQIHLEITEQSMIDASTLKKQMQTMVCDGFQFSLDDYGSGYSNTIGVVGYPLANVKIDREIIVSYFDNPSSLLPNEIKIFLDMDFSVTAEGVESQEMAEKLTEFGCSFLQGFYFSKPLTMEEFLNRYRKKELA
jgi:EAL domain-containing protein (putative c-di-GMP-specific phosphodiesterase class I)